MEPNLPCARLKGIGLTRAQTRGNKMKKRLFAAISASILVSSLISIAPASAGSFCNNGSYSSNSGRGTCSWNGGVNKSFPSFSDPGSSSFKRNNGFGSSRSNGLGSTSTWGNSLNSKRSCLSLLC
jgi:hypothetical protein